MEILKMLINHGADVNTEPFGDSVLHWAAIKGQAEAAKLLIQNGARIDHQNTSGANPNIVASNGFTPLITAYKWPGVKDREGIAELPRQYGAK